MNGWKCPACSRVFAPHVSECKPCNAAIKTGAAPASDPLPADMVPAVLPSDWRPVQHRWPFQPNFSPPSPFEIPGGTVLPCGTMLLNDPRHVDPVIIMSRAHVDDLAQTSEA